MKTFYTAQKCTECLSSSSVNNSTEDEKITDFSMSEMAVPADGELTTEDSDDEIVDFEDMDQPTRRKLMRRLRETPFKRRQSGSPYEPGSELDVAWRSAVEKPRPDRRLKKLGGQRLPLRLPVCWQMRCCVRLRFQRFRPFRC